MSFSQDTHDRAKEIIARYPEGRDRSALLPLLHLVQAEHGYVTPAGIAFCAERLGLTKAEVAAVATFYTMYKRRPAGQWLVSVCTNTMCGVLGGDKTFGALTEYLGVGHDETTADGSITLEHAECLAACDYAPVLTVNYEYFDKVDADTAIGLAKQLQSGERPHPSRGARLCTFKEMSMQLAGYPDQREGAAGEGPAGEATLAGNRLAERFGVSVPGFDPETPISKRQPGGPGNVKPETAPEPASDAKPAGDSPTPQKRRAPVVRKRQAPPAVKGEVPPAAKGEVPPAAKGAVPPAAKGAVPPAAAKLTRPPAAQNETPAPATGEASAAAPQKARRRPSPRKSTKATPPKETDQ
jgi:NADH-quinone oxidoreductase subunit E